MYRLWRPVLLRQRPSANRPGSGPSKASESRASLIFPSPRSDGEKVAEGRMRGISRQLNHPSPGLASLATLSPLTRGEGKKKDRLSPHPTHYSPFASL